MVRVLDMQFIRYANLFSKVTRLTTNHCFEYNHTVIFVVPRKLVMQAIGPDSINLRKLSEIIGKKVKVIAAPNGISDLNGFVSIITYPVKFKSVEIKDGEAVINANIQSKASLIGKEKARLLEMENILGQYFGVRKVRVK